jgi:hypothetical protein
MSLEEEDQLSETVFRSEFPEYGYGSDVDFEALAAEFVRRDHPDEVL